MAGTKRKYDYESNGESPSNKSRPNKQVEPRVDPTYGQRSALPGLDEIATKREADNDSLLSFEDEMDAQSYLRSVRLVRLVTSPEDTFQSYTDMILF